MRRGGVANGGVIAALIGGMVIYGLAMGTTYPLLGVLLAQDMGGAWNGLSASATGLGLLVGIALVPGLSHRVGAGRTALIGIGLLTAALATLAVVRDYWVIFCARLVLGCGANLLFVITETALNVFAPPDRRGRVMGIYTAAIALGFVIGPAVVAGSPETPALLLLACAAISAVALVPFGAARTRVDGHVHPPSVSRILPAVANYPFAFAFVCIASALDAIILSFYPVVAFTQGFPVEVGALLVAIFHVGLMVGQPLIGLTLDRFGRRRTLLVCCVLSFLCTLGLSAGAEIGFWGVAVLMVVWGATNYGLYTGGLALIGDRYVGAALTAATAAFAAVYALAAVVAPLLAGGLVQGTGAAGLHLAAAGLYGAVMLAAAYRFRPPEPTLSMPARPIGRVV